MPDFTCLDENLFAKVAQTLLQHISSTHCNFKSALGPSILLLCVRLADVQMNGFINYCEVLKQSLSYFREHNCVKTSEIKYQRNPSPSPENTGPRKSQARLQ